jgi:hypothetical protein
MELTWDWRVTNLERGDVPWYDTRLIYKFLNSNFEVVDGAPGPTYSSKDTDGWESRSAKFLVPPTASYLVVMATVFRAKSGTLDIDNFVLKPTGSDELKVAAAKREAEEKRMYVAPEAPDPSKWPKALHVEGNQILDSDGEVVMLRGVSTGGLETIPQDRHPPRSVIEAIEVWNANVVRMPVKDTFWFGRSSFQKDGGKAYREMVDFLVTLAANRGAYLIIDLHRFRAPRAEHVAFWKDVAARYKDHPAVLFEVFNEPHDISWEVWRDGGWIGEKKKPGDEDAFLNEEDLKKTNEGYQSVGMQALVDAVRDTGANNPILCSGLFWSGDLRGITKGYALDDKGGDGIIYVWHVYNWHTNWDDMIADTAKEYPILVSEFGCDVKKMGFIPEEIQENPYTWAPDALGYMDEMGLHYTAWCFHPKATPVLISDWEYTPTPFWGEFVKRALHGEKFKMKKKR